MNILSFKNKDILVIASDAGAALCLSEIIKKLKLNNTIRVFSLLNSYLTFKNNGIESNIIKNLNVRMTSKKLLDENKCDLIFLGTNIGYGLEKQVTLDAKKKNIFTIAFIDHFWHPWQRFSDLKGKRKNIFLPNYIFALNKTQKRHLLQNKVPEKKIKILEHQYLSKLRIEKPTNNKSNVCSELNINKDNKIIVLATEPGPFIPPIWSSEEPTEKAISKNTIALLETLEIIYKINHNFTLIIKRHPTEKKVGFKGQMNKILKFSIILDDFHPKKLIGIADLVLGFSSMFLLESNAMGKDVSTLNIGNENYGKVMNENGIKTIKSKSELLKLLNKKLGIRKV